MIVSTQKNIDMLYPDKGETLNQLVTEIVTLIRQSDMTVDEFFRSTAVYLPVEQVVKLYATVLRNTGAGNCFRMERVDAKIRSTDHKKQCVRRIPLFQEGGAFYGIS